MFDWLKRKPQPTATLRANLSSAPAEPGFAVTITGPHGQGVDVQVSDTEIAERVRAHAFVLDTDPPALKTAEQWWEEEANKRRLREGSDKAYAWLLPFLPKETAALEPLQKAMQWGPHSAKALAKELRVLIRAKRKAKEPHQDLLQALYGACVMADLSASLAFEGTQPHHMAQFVSLVELQDIQCDYPTMGYQCIEALGKTDAKWLVDAFGEPAEHQSFDASYPHIRRNAIARYCWADLRRSRPSSQGVGQSREAMHAWLCTLAKRTIGYDKEWQERVSARAEQIKEQAVGLDAAWAATREPFVVADLETTGLNAATDEILEFAAVLVEPDGTVTGEFATLVRVTRPVPPVITRLTGISQTEADTVGRPLAEAMTAFITFVGTRPVFFHNAPFDTGFLKQASGQSKKKFSNPVHDTLPLARVAWPELGSYKLCVLAEHVGTTAPTHRGLADVRATLAVLLAARAQLSAQ